MAKKMPLYAPEYLDCIDEVDLGAAEEDREGGDSRIGADAGKEPGGFGELVFYMWRYMISSVFLYGTATCAGTGGHSS
jgi:hypothetical protein